jgi:hypothetical protein
LWACKALLEELGRIIAVESRREPPNHHRFLYPSSSFCDGSL